MARAKKPVRKASRLQRVAHLHGRLIASAVIGGAVTLGLGLTKTTSEWLTAGLIGWDAGVLLYLIVAVVTLSRFDIERVRRLASEEDEGGVFVLILTVLAAAASFAAIIHQLGAMDQEANKALYFSHAALTIALSWAFIHTIFAFHYAHEYYGEGRDRRHGGLTFPEDPEPDYWDFIYFSFVVGMTFQVSDVQVNSKVIRRLVVAHGLVSFAFNVAILAVTVNIGSSLIGPSR